MKKVLLIILAFSSFVILFFGLKKYQDHNSSKNETSSNRQDSNLTELKTGDIIFHKSKSSQSDVLESVTKSIYTHCGLIWIDGKKKFVLEAVGPVKLTPLKEWINSGKGNHYVVKRLKNADSILTVEGLRRMKAETDNFMGKNYDSKFCWDDKNIYCSELVWKIYKRAIGIEVGKLQTFDDFDLTGPSAVQLIKNRNMENIPGAETVISPVAIFESGLLMKLLER